MQDCSKVASCLCELAAGELVESLGGEVDGHDVFVSFFSVTNAVGRLTAGFLPERALHAFGIPRHVTENSTPRGCTAFGA